MASTLSLVISESDRKSQEIPQSGDCGGHTCTRSCTNVQWMWPHLLPHSQDYKNAHTFWTHHLWRLNAETHHSAESFQQTHSAYLSDPRSRWQKCLHSSSAGRRKLKMCEQICIFIFPQRKPWQIVPGSSLTCPPLSNYAFWNSHKKQKHRPVRAHSRVQTGWQE